MAETVGCEALKLFVPALPTMWRNKADMRL